MRNAKDIVDATHSILPGVGSARATMESLHDMELISTMMENDYSVCELKEYLRNNNISVRPLRIKQ